MPPLLPEKLRPAPFPSTYSLISRTTGYQVRWQRKAKQGEERERFYSKTARTIPSPLLAI
jgi:hypothetical protein